VIVDLSRNFGHHKAMMTGLDHARGDLVFLIDSDLEEDPECMREFAIEMSRTKADVVFGVQETRRGSWFQRVSGNLFFDLFNAVTGIAMPKNMVTARLMTKRYVDALVLHREQEVFIGGLWHITGFKQVPFAVVKHST